MARATDENRRRKNVRTTPTKAAKAGAGGTGSARARAVRPSGGRRKSEGRSKLLEDCRTKAWAAHVREAIAGNLGDGDIGWTRVDQHIGQMLGDAGFVQQTRFNKYANANIHPNETTLRLIDQLIPGSRSVHDHGPCGVPLWAACVNESTDDIVRWFREDWQNPLFLRAARSGTQARYFALPYSAEAWLGESFVNALRSNPEVLAELTTNSAWPWTDILGVEVAITGSTTLSELFWDRAPLRPVRIVEAPVWGSLALQIAEARGRRERSAAIKLSQGRQGTLTRMAQSLEALGLLSGLQLTVIPEPHTLAIDF